MASLGVVGSRRREAAFSLAAVLLLGGLLALLLITSGIPVARADGPVLIASTGTTNAGGEVLITGTGWAPATKYDLYLYGQAKCKPDPICLPPSGTKPINTKQQPIDKNGDFGPFDFTFNATAPATTYVFTVIADYPADTPFSASVLVQVVPAGTPPSGTPVSSSPTATPTPTAAAATPTKAAQTGGGSGGQSTNTGGGNTLAIIVVTVLLLIGIAILTGLLIVLPPKRRAIRAAWYGMGGPSTTGGRGYGASGPVGQPRPRNSGYVSGPVDPPEWMGGVAQWDDQPRGPRGSGSRPRRDY